MDNHPIPQDVTHFQFKLIGNLTLKQFGYVAAGGISAWIAISTGLPFLIKLLIAITLAGSGLIFAFFPIEGRPADLMLRYFFQALFQPNQYLYQKQGGENALIDAPAVMTNRIPTSPAQQTQPMQQQKTVLPSGIPVMKTMPMNSLSPRPIPTAPLQTSQQLQPQQSVMKQQTPVVSPLDLGATIPTQVQQPPVPAVKHVSPLPETKPIPQQQLPVTQNQMQQLPGISPITPTAKPMSTEPIHPPTPEINPVPQTVTPPTPNLIKTPLPKEETPQIQDQLQQTLAQKKQLEEQLEQLKKQLEQTKQATANIDNSPTTLQESSGSIQSTQQPEIPKPVSPVIKTVPMAPKTSQTPMVSDFPNIIMGVVKDARGNVLPNILIEVKDADDNPVRAFKTNALGQFASATPLLNGTYTILFEDPAKKHNFDAVEIEVTGEIMQPIEIISHDEREDLRKELFG